MLGADILDLGRIENGELSVGSEDVSVAAVLAVAIADTCVEPNRVEIDVASTLPPVNADATLLRRALVEAMVEAIDASPQDVPVRVVAGAVWPGVDVRIIDRRRRSAAAEAASARGAGAFVAQAFVLAMRGQVEIDETPGGGTTLVIRLPAADPGASA